MSAEHAFFCFGIIANSSGLHAVLVIICLMQPADPMISSHICVSYEANSQELHGLFDVFITKDIPGNLTSGKFFRRSDGNQSRMLAPIGTQIQPKTLVPLLRLLLVDCLVKSSRVKQASHIKFNIGLTRPSLVFGKERPQYPARVCRLQSSRYQSYWFCRIVRQGKITWLSKANL